jgi:L-ribulose-5-phosphate 3-epimerase
MKICYFADEVSEDFDEAVKLGVEAGADSVEIRGGLWGDSVTTVTDDGVKRMQDVLAKYEVTVADIGSPVGKCSHIDAGEYETHLRYFDRMVELAKALDSGIIRIFAFWNPLWKSGQKEKRPDIDDYLEIIAEKLTPIVRIAEREKIVLAFENENTTLAGSCSDVKKVIEILGGGPALSCCWDVVNGVHCDESPYPEGYGYIKGRVSHFHIKPNDARQLNPVWNTSVTYQDIFKAVESDGFDGAVSIEHWGSPELMLQGIRELKAALS